MLAAAVIGFYGEALSITQRRDLSAALIKMQSEMGLYVEDGANLLIKNQWLEQPFLATDHEDLINKKFQ